MPCSQKLKKIKKIFLKNFENNFKNAINDLDNGWIKLTDDLPNMILLYKAEINDF